MKKFLSCIALVCTLSSCNNIPNEKGVSVTNVEITGFIKDYVKVVDGTYKFTHNGDEAYISVKFELTNTPKMQFCPDGVLSDIRLNAIDDSNNILDTGVYGFSMSTDDFKKIDDLLHSSIGTTKVVSFRWNYFKQDAKSVGKNIFTKSSTFEIIDKRFKTDCNDSKIVSKNAEITNSANNLDKVLDEYENYVNSYVKLLKNNTDEDFLNNMTEYSTLLEKADALGKQLESVKGTLTPTQLKRYNEITIRVVNTMK
jgi:hypothetical protein